MAIPASVDVAAKTQLSAEIRFLESQKDTHNESCLASLENLQKNCSDAGWISIHSNLSKATSVRF